MSDADLLTIVAFVVLVALTLMIVPLHARLHREES